MSDQTLLQRALRFYITKVVAKYPALLIISSLAVGLVLAAGILVKGLVVDSDPQKIWVPLKSNTALQQNYFNAAFDPFFRVNQIIISFSNPADNNNTDFPAGIMSREYLEAIYYLQMNISSAVASDGTVLDDVCYRPIKGKGCLIESPLDYFRDNLTIIQQLDDAIIQDAMACKKILDEVDIPCMNDIGVPVQPQVVLGGIGCTRGEIPGFNQSVCGGCGTAADAVMLTFLLQNTNNENSHALNWEADVFLPYAANFSYPGLQVSYMAERSITDQLTIVEHQNEYIVLISYAAMFVYIAFALGKFPHPIANRTLLGFQGVLIVGLSVAASLGICAWAGMHISMIVSEVVPFLILAIGVDNMFIIVRSFDKGWWGPAGRTSAGSLGQPTLTLGNTNSFRGGLNIFDAATETLVDVGPTMVAACCSEVLAFVVGLTTGVPALQQFCGVAALAVGLDFVLQMTWFLPAVLMDARRQEERRMDVLFCIRMRGRGVKETTCSFPLMRFLRWSFDSMGEDQAIEEQMDYEPPLAIAEVDFGLRDGYAGSERLINNSIEAIVPTDTLGSFSGRPRHRGSSGTGSSLGNVHEVFSSGKLNSLNQSFSMHRPDDLSSIGSQDSNMKKGSLSGKFWYYVNRGGFMRLFMGTVFTPVVLHPITRILTILIWFALLGISIFGITQFQLGLEQQLILPTGSYLSSYFSQLARLGEAGAPVYFVLQSVNYTNVNASDAIGDLAAAMGGMQEYIVAPVYSWLGDFNTWNSEANRQYVNQNPDLNCPTPLDPANSTFAAMTSQFVYDCEIDIPCCQSAGFCGAQYSSDVKFLWGIPKPAPNASESLVEYAFVTTASTEAEETTESVEAIFISSNGQIEGPDRSFATKPSGSHARFTAPSGGRQYSSRTTAIRVKEGTGVLAAEEYDDGGCDLSFGMLSHAEMEHLMLAASDYSNLSGDISSKNLVPLEFLHASSILPSSAMALLRDHPSIEKHSVAGLDSNLVGDNPDFVPFIACHVMTSRLRAQHTPLRNQSDFIGAMQHTQRAVEQLVDTIPLANLSLYGLSVGALQPGSVFNTSFGIISDNEHLQWLPDAPGGAAFPYSLFYVYYEQYNNVRGIVINMVAIGIAAVLGAAFFVSVPPVAIVTALMVLSITICLCGWLWMLNPHGVSDPYGSGPYGVDINAVSVVNLVTAIGLAVEFIIHIASSFARAAVSKEALEGDEALKRSTACCSGDAPIGGASNIARARFALINTGSSVVTGITLTKLLGVCILGWAPSQLFKLYYFRMYLGIIVLGAFHGLLVLPTLLGTFGLGL